MSPRPSGPLSIDSSFGRPLALRAMRAREALSTVSEFELDVVSTSPDLKGTDVLAQWVTAHLQVNGQPRHWNGFVVGFQYLGTGNDGYTLYRLVARPWIWYLTQVSDCRIFQNMSVPDILADVFRNRGFADFETVLREQYKLREYTVQYRETDFAFISRLMESEGLYYYFRHEATRHVLVIADTPDAHQPVTGYESIPVLPPDPNRHSTMEHVRSWNAVELISTTRFAHADYDFTAPRKPLYETTSAPDATPTLEVYEYPGNFMTWDDGETYAKLRLQQARAVVKTWRGEANARGITVGATFDLVNRDRAADQGRYLITGSEIVLRGPDPRATRETTEPDVYSCKFEVIAADTTFRVRYATPKPVARGPLTALVVGSEGAEIFTDQYGRVKVQFYWDRVGHNDQASSCWLRVAQSWAGTGFGAQFIPRVGQEVVVDFLDGDPDRPIVIGCVYNGTHDVPFDLPVNQTQSGFRTRSSPRGALNWNELRFEDLTGNEEVYLQAAKDLNVLVKNDENDEIVNDRTVSVGVDEMLSVGGNRTRTVTMNEAVTVAVAQAVTVGTTQAINVGLSQSVSVGDEQKIRVTNDRGVNVGGDETIDIVGNRKVNVGTDLSQAVTGDVRTKTGGLTDQRFAKDYTERHHGHRTVIVGTGDARRSSVVHVEGRGRAYASKTFEVEALEGFTLICGKSQISVTPSGITLNSPNITLAGKEVDIVGDTLDAKVSNQVTVGSQTITFKTAGANVTLDASAASVTATQVKLAGGSGSTDQASSKPVTITKVQMKDAQGKPRANARVLLIQGDEQRMTVLDKDGMLELIGDDSYQVLFPDDAGAK
jgi:type VI secretion system secreted protein VgrG